MGKDPGELNRFRVAVVGAGPAGLFTADELWRRGAAVDVFERSFAPFGLLRSGVAPDRQETKRMQAMFERIPSRAGVRFFGNVTLGVDVHVSYLLKHYDRVVLALGSGESRPLDVPGAESDRSWSARDFIDWYNGNRSLRAPARVSASRPKEPSPPLDSERVVILGAGSIALEMARILSRHPSELERTDVAPAALAVLRKSKVREIVVVGRRAAHDAAFQESELNSIRELLGIEVVTDDGDDPATSEFTDVHRSGERHVRPRATRASRRIVLCFRRRAREVIDDDGPGPSTIVLERTTTVREQGRELVRGTGLTEEVRAALVIHSYGFSTTVVPGVPFDEKLGVIPSARGRVLDTPGGSIVPRLYVAGWSGHGAQGNIASQRSDAERAVAALVQDVLEDGLSGVRGDLPTELRERGHRLVTWDDWKKLDAHELHQGERVGKVRLKLESMEEALDVLDDRLEARGSRATESRRRRAPNLEDDAPDTERDRVSHIESGIYDPVEPSRPEQRSFVDTRERVRQSSSDEGDFLVAGTSLHKPR